MNKKSIILISLLFIGILGYAQSVPVPDKTVSVVQTVVKEETTTYVIFKLPDMDELKTKAKAYADTATIMILAKPEVQSYLDSMDRVTKKVLKDIKKDAH